MAKVNDDPYYLDYRLEYRDRTLENPDTFWEWFRADNLAVSRLLPSVVSQRVFTPLSGRVGAVLERVEVHGLTGVADYFRELAQAKTELPPNRGARFFGHVEVTDLRLRSLGPRSVADDPCPGRIIVSETFAFREAARADVGGFWNALAASSAEVTHRFGDVEKVQAFAEVIGRHHEMTRWIAFSTSGGAVEYMEAASRAVPGPGPALPRQWARIVDRSVMQEVSNV